MRGRERESEREKEKDRKQQTEQERVVGCLSLTDKRKCSVSPAPWAFSYNKCLMLVQFRVAAV